ncbi:MAG TPA: prephenate dehydrogenase/arogenate dehydrogenase family protein [Candidatus Nanopelagicales bacterium]|nr:prephenate dehydrogenase/arogenate dehydrogenase family protein [Candidatus Nanopelagicales bacterium]
MRLALLGLGLIGGSVARAAHAAGWQVVAWTPSGAAPRIARAEGAIDVAAGTLREAVDGADLVVLAAPPLACGELLGVLAGIRRDALRRDVVISDVASTKALLVQQAAALGLRFVGGHPMAGRDESGFAAGSADLFRDRPWVVVPPAATDEEAVARVEELARACGARPVRMTAAEHDAAVAAISHLPLVVAAALVEAVAGGPGDPVPSGWPAAAALAAGGWAGATRLARGDPEMGAGIAATNAGPLAAGVRAVRERLGEWLLLLEAGADDGSPDEAALRERFAAARDRLRGPG